MRSPFIHDPCAFFFVVVVVVTHLQLEIHSPVLVVFGNM